MRIVITGGTGFLGRRLCRALLAEGHELAVLSRRPAEVPRLCGAAAEPLAGLAAWRPERRVDAVVNLAGAPVFDARWTTARKAELWASRVDFTRALVEHLTRLPAPPALLVSGSAVGYYGDRGDEAVTEACGASDDFLGRLCAAWEAEALKASPLGLRVVLLRTGLVLHPAGGALTRMLPAFRLGLGARLGNGRQWMSWIHADDWTALTQRVLADPQAQGAFNLTAPEPVTNRAFTAALAAALRRPACLAAPAWLLRPLLGARAALLLDSLRALPARGEALGYRFSHPALAEALRSLL